jgi:7-keto-8-aminopelargonate synthetase-like enzyme
MEVRRRRPALWSEETAFTNIDAIAILLCSPLIRQYLINYARPLIYTTFLSYPALAAIRASYTYLQCGKTEIVGAYYLPPATTTL